MIASRYINVTIDSLQKKKNLWEILGFSGVYKTAMPAILCS